MLMLAPLAVRSCPSVVVCDGRSGIGSALASSIATRGGDAGVVYSPLLEGWQGLKDVCNGSDTVYLLSALDLPPLPNDADLQAFSTGVGKVVDCCLEGGVEALVFTSSSSVVRSERRGRGKGRGIGRRGDDMYNAEERLTSYVTREEDTKAHVVAQAEARVLEASGAGESSSRLHTIALRPPAIIYGAPEQQNDGLVYRTLSGLGLELNRVAVGPKRDAGAIEADVVHIDNLVEAHVLAGAKLRSSPVDGGSGGGGGGRLTPACSGKAYFVADGQPRDVQAFLDEILGALGFVTSKLVRVPTGLALLIASAAELASKAGLAATPALTVSDVRTLTESRIFSSARAKRDLGYVPRIDNATAMERTVESLRQAGWARHRVLRPGLGYWLCCPGSIWLVALAAFGQPCPPFLAPLARHAQHVGLLLLHDLSTVRTVFAAVFLIHVLEGVYAFRVATRAGHRDTAPSWFVQTFLLGFPSIRLVNQLKVSKSQSQGSA